jgi:COP9 signalosome complex subunit 3
MSKLLDKCLNNLHNDNLNSLDLDDLLKDIIAKDILIQTIDSIGFNNLSLRLIILLSKQDPELAIIYFNKFISSISPSVYFDLNIFEKHIVDLPLPPIYLLEPLATAIDRFIPEDYLSPLHCSFVLLCLKSKCFGYAVPVISKKLTRISLERTKGKKQDHFLPSIKNSEDILLYFYYSGLIFIGLKRWEEAFDQLLFCLYIPAFAISAIAVEAYKKYLLVSLILHGSVIPFNEPCSHVVSSFFSYIPTVNSHGVEGKDWIHYLEFSREFIILNSVPSTVVPSDEWCQTLLSKYETIFKKDANFGLAKQALVSLRKHILVKLSQVYQVISMEKITSMIGASNVEITEQLIYKMVEEDLISCQIDKKNFLVSFSLQNVYPKGVVDGNNITQQLIESVEWCKNILKMEKQLKAQETKIITKESSSE